jgi:hypothetical protein
MKSPDFIAQLCFFTTQIEKSQNVNPPPLTPLHDNVQSQSDQNFSNFTSPQVHHPVDDTVTGLVMFKSKTAAGAGLAVAGLGSQSSTSPFPCSTGPAILWRVSFRGLSKQKYDRWEVTYHPR